ncbi:MAG: cupin domain-containing protein [Gammaproteobacteria bacterium]|nr:cupin domain-containing protein [Gammaproteobacteria bacterium]
MIDKIASEWELLGYSCDVWKDVPGQRWENFTHDSDELFMLIKGKIELEIEGKSCQPLQNQVVHIPANTMHSVRNIGKTEAHWLYGYKLPNVNEHDIKNFNQ